MFGYERGLRMLIIGPHEHGKTTVARVLAERWGLRAADTGDAVMASYANLHDMDVRLVRERKADLRPELLLHGDEMRSSEPSALARAALANADIVTGCYRKIEYAAARHLFDFVMWVSRIGKDAETALTPNDAQHVLAIPDCQGEITKLREEILCRISEVLEAIQMPEVYVAGRYRVFTASGQWDDAAMAANAEQELEYGTSCMAENGERAFLPVNVHLPLDRLPDGVNRCVAACVEKIHRMRPGKDRLAIVRPWQCGNPPGQPESSGVRAEIDAALTRGLMITSEY